MAPDEKISKGLERITKMKNPVKKNMDKFHKPRTHKDHKKYDRKESKADTKRQAYDMCRWL